MARARRRRAPLRRRPISIQALRGGERARGRRCKAGAGPRRARVRRGSLRCSSAREEGSESLDDARKHGDFLEASRVAPASHRVAAFSTTGLQPSVHMDMDMDMDMGSQEGATMGCGL